MSTETRESLVTQLDEVEAQIREMVGATNVAVDGFSADESKALEDMRQRRLELEARIAAVDAGGSSGDTARAANPSGSF